MMKTFFIFFICLISYNALQSQAGKWVLLDSSCVIGQSGFPYGIWNKAIDCADSNNCIIVGNRGLLSPWNKVTADGGITWNTTLKDTSYNDSNNIRIYTPAKAQELAYPDTNLCIVICDSGYYWRSTDKCSTWKRFKLQTNRNLKNVSFFNKEFGGIASYSELFITENSGNNWTIIDDLNYSDSIENNSYVDISSPDDETILSLLWKKESGNMIIRSTDRGITWVRHYMKTPRVEKIFFISRDIGWAAGRQQIEPNSSYYRDIILKTTDGGATWKVQLDSLCKNMYGLMQIYFVDELNGAALGEWWDLWKTSDGGETWISDETYKRENVSGYLSDIELLNSTYKIIGVSMDYWTIFKFSDEPDDVVDNNEQAPEKHLKIYPNPVISNSPLNISFDVNRSSNLELRIYNLIGELMDEPHTVFMEAGEHTLSYTPSRKFPAGVYYVRMTIDGGEALTGSFVVE